MAKKKKDENVLIEEQGVKYILIGDEKYRLPRLNLNLMKAMEDYFDIGIRQIGNLLVERQATTSLRLITFLINYPDGEITEDEIGEKVDYEDMPKIGAAIRDILMGE